MRPEHSLRYALFGCVMLAAVMLSPVMAQDGEATEEPAPISEPATITPSPTTEPATAPTLTPSPTFTLTAAASPTAAPPTPTEPVATEPVEPVTAEATEASAEATAEHTVPVSESVVSTAEATTPPLNVTAEVTEVVATEAPVEHLPATPELGVLLLDSFDSDSDQWELAAGWRIGDGVLTADSAAEAATLTSESRFNMAAQVRVQGTARLSVRASSAAAYTAEIDPGGTVNLYRGTTLIAGGGVAPAADGWYTLRLSAINDIVRVSVDDAEIISLRDDAPLPPGTVTLACDPTGQTRFDDFGLLVPVDELPTQQAAASVPRTSMTFTVNTTSDADDGTCDATHCSLREAINAANANGDASTITFDIPTSDPGYNGSVEAFFIVPTSALPVISAPVTIDGYTQIGAFRATESNEAKLLILIKGRDAGATDGLTLQTSDSTITGLVVNEYSGAGILVSGANATNNTITGNYLGTDITGRTPVGNLYGVALTNGAANNTIGGTTPAERNVIGGNTSHGVYLSDSDGNAISGSYIGMDSTGDTARPNGGDGVHLADGSSSNIVGGQTGNAENSLGGNDGNGVHITGTTSDNNSILGNNIGMDTAGTLARGNVLNGILLANGASGTLIRGNLIAGNDGDGIQINGDGTDDTTIILNFIGTDLTGALPRGNDNGINIIGGERTQIGGTTQLATNVISGNGGSGIIIAGVSESIQATDTTIQSNRIGTNVAGMGDLGNGGSGILLGGFTETTVIGGTAIGAANLISANSQNGIEIQQNVSDTFISGNLIGTNVTGTLPLGNGASGIAVDRSLNTVVGPLNLISGNTGAGIAVFNSDPLATDPTSTTIEGNLIGISATGVNPLGNSIHGVLLNNGAENVTVGGTTAAARNIISGNALSGVLLGGAATTNNIVQGNFIGTDTTGTLALGNSESGIAIVDGASGNTVGGTDAGAGNRIWYNGQAGVLVTDDSTNNPILGNSIFTNGEETEFVTFLGIDLSATDTPDSVTPNDADDPDTGPNNFQNFPSLTGFPTLTEISGVLDSTPNTTFRVELFASAFCENNGYGEGERYIGFVDVTTDANGDADFVADISGATPLEYITATATGPGGTSEFSACQIYDLVQSGDYVVNTTDDTDDGLCAAAHCSLREAINTANAEPGANNIFFNIPGDGPHTIQPASALPDITDPVTIDGSTQHDFVHSPLIVLDGADTVAGGLQVLTNDSVIRGLVFQRFSDYGIVVQGDRNVIAGNYLGTDATGTLSRGNGVGLELVGANNQIGGPNNADGNIISGNSGSGIMTRIIGGDQGNVIQGNIIGADVTGTEPLGNAIYGVIVYSLAGGGGGGSDSVTWYWQATLPDATMQISQNIIAYNGAAGVSLDSVRTVALTDNAIFANSGLGIDVAPDGVNPNDNLDMDEETNDFQNFPVLTAVTAVDEISGALDSEPSETYRVELFANTSCDLSGHGEGERYLGFVEVTTDANGDAIFTADVTGVVAGEFLTATATDADGNTSEFSTCLDFAQPLPVVGAPQLLTPGDGTETNDNTPTLTWTAVPEAPQYEIEFAFDDDFRNDIVSFTSDATTFDVPTPLPDGRLYWRVRGVGLLGPGPWSDGNRLDIDATPPSELVELRSPENLEQVDDVEPKLSWRSVRDAREYRLQVDDSPTFDSPLVDVVQRSTIYRFDAPLAQGTYYWRVAAIDELGNQGTFAVTPQFDVNIMRRPDNADVTTDTTPSFSWSRERDQVYTLLIDEAGGDFSTPVYTCTTDGSSCRLDNSDALPVGNYRWRVDINSVASPFTRSLTITPPLPARPDLLGERRFDTNAANLLLDWDLVDGIDLTYELQIDDDRRFRSPEVIVTGLTDTQYTLDTTALDDARLYWQVRAVNTFGAAGRWSSSYEFTLDRVAPDAPDLRDPLDGELTGDTTPRLTWQRVRDADVYQIDVATDAGFTNRVVDNAVTNRTNFTVEPALTPETDYFWRARSVDDAGNIGANSITGAFTVTRLRDPEPDDEITSGRPTFRWSGDRGERYTVEVVVTGESFAAPFVFTCDTGSTSCRPDADLPFGTFDWRLLVNGTPTQIITFTITPRPPSRPDTVNPPNRIDTNDATLTLTWLPPDGASYTYQLEIDDSRRFNDPEVQVTRDTTSYDLDTSSLDDYRWYWRVAAINEYGVVGQWSRTYEFTLDRENPSAPELRDPVGGELTIDTTPRLSWDRVRDADFYQIDIATDDTFSNLIISNAPENRTSYTPPVDLTAEQTYFWRARSVDDAGNVSANSITGVFQVSQMRDPEAGEAVTQDRPMFRWQSNRGSTYLVEVIAEGGDFAAPLATCTTTGSSCRLDDVLAFGVYQWRLLEDGTPLSTLSFIITPSEPDAPRDFTPERRTETNNNPLRLTWDATRSDDSALFTYVVQIDDDRRFRSPDVVAATGGNRFYDLDTSLLADGRWYWQVQTVNQYGAAGRWSSPQDFTLDREPPDAPDLRDPDTRTVTDDRTPRLRWDRVRDAAVYRVEFATDPAFNNLVFDAQITNRNTWQVPDALALSNGTYYWRVQSVDEASNIGSYSPARELIIEATE